MKRYNFYVFFLVLWSYSVIFVVQTSGSSANPFEVTIFDAKDVAKYWLIKQMWKKHNKDIADNNINSLLVTLKKAILMPQKDFFQKKGIIVRTIHDRKQFFWFDYKLNPLYQVHVDLPRPIPLDIFIHASDLHYPALNRKKLEEEKNIGGPVTFIYSEGHQWGGSPAYDRFLPNSSSYKTDTNCLIDEQEKILLSVEEFLSWCLKQHEPSAMQLILHDHDSIPFHPQKKYKKFPDFISVNPPKMSLKWIDPDDID